MCGKDVSVSFWITKEGVEIVPPMPPLKEPIKWLICEPGKEFLFNFSDPTIPTVHFAGDVEIPYTEPYI